MLVRNIALSETMLSNTNEAQSGVKSTRFYRPELDVLRFLAFLMVFVHHILPHEASAFAHISSNRTLQSLAGDFASALGAGLPLFFLLSAYLITTLLLREKRRSGTVHVPSFYIRRVLRIWPLYLTVIGLSWLAAYWKYHEQRSGMFLAYLLLMGNWSWWLGVSASTPLEIGHLWSISVEEQFYLFFPVVARLVRPRFLYRLSVALAFGAVVAIFHECHAGIPLAAIWRITFVQFIMFAAGIAMGLYFDTRRLPNFTWVQRFFLAFLAFAVILSAEHRSGAMSGVGVSSSAVTLVLGYTAVSLACSLLLLSFLGFEGSLPNPLIYLGKISYGLYVFHAWVLNGSTASLHVLGVKGAGLTAMKDTLAFVLTIIVAILSYKILETPFLNLKERFAFVQSRPA